MLFGFGRVPGCLGLGALFLWDEWRDERTVCQRGGCMVVPGAVVSPGHTRRLRRLSCRAPHNSPCTLMRTWLRQMDGAYSAACGRRVPSRQVPQVPSMTSGLLRRTGSRPCSRPAGSLSVLVLGCEGVVVCREGVGYQRCAGWLQGLSFLVVCWEMVWHRRCAGCGWGEFFGVLS